MKPISRAVMVAGIAGALSVTAMLPAHAGTKNEQATQFAGCIHGNNGVSKSAKTELRTGVTWSGRAVSSGYSNATGWAVDCQRATGITGSVAMQDYGHVSGRHLTSCDVGIRSGCSFNPSHTYAKWSESLARGNASAHGRSITIGGISVVASRTGSVDDWYATGKTTIYYYGSTATAIASIHIDL